MLSNIGDGGSHSALCSFSRHSLKGAIQLKNDAFAFAGSACTDLYLERWNDQSIVIKMWRGASFSDEERRLFIQRLCKELDIWKTLQHRNIAQFHGLAQLYGPLPSLVFSYYENGNVMDYLKKNKDADVLPILHGVASALSYMHNLSSPVAHGDIKGSNILIDDKGEALLSDFGLSSVASYSNFSTGNVGGSCRWMSPEMIDPDPPSENGEYPRTPASDVYSFAMTALEICTGEQPFAHRRHNSVVIFDIIDGRRPPRPTNCANVTDMMWELMESCWKQRPKQRLPMNAVKLWLQLQAHITQIEEQ